MPTSQDGRGGEDVEGSTPEEHSSSRSDSMEDVEGIGDDSSTASGGSVAEEGWESGHGLDPREAAVLGLEAVGKGEGGEGGSKLPAAVQKRNSFRRAFDKARWVLVLTVTADCCRMRALCSTVVTFVEAASGIVQNT